MPKRGLPNTLRMRHDEHYVEALAASAGAPIGKMVVMFVGASMFAVGGLMLLVVMARPLFEKRDVDHIVDEIKDELTDQRPRL